MDSILFLQYPKCTTCKKAKKWLIEKGVSFEIPYIGQGRASILPQVYQSSGESPISEVTHDAENF